MTAPVPADPAPQPKAGPSAARLQAKEAASQKPMASAAPRATASHSTAPSGTNRVQTGIARDGALLRAVVSLTEAAKPRRGAGKPPMVYWATVRNRGARATIAPQGGKS